jgi:hypothetical protein
MKPTNQPPNIRRTTMENQTNTTSLTPIVAIKVNDFEWSKKGDRHYCATNAKISVKIQNAIQEIILSFDKDYQTKKYKVSVRFTNDNFVRTLEQLGFSVDLESVKKEYQEQALEILKQEKAELIVTRGAAWDNSWAVKNLVAISAVVTGAEVVPSREVYINQDRFETSVYIRAKYRNTAFSIRCVSINGNSNRYECSSFTKKIWSSNLDKLVTKIAEHINDEMEKNDLTKKREESTKKTQQDIISKIAYPTKVETTPHYDNRGRYTYTSSYYRVKITDSNSLSVNPSIDKEETTLSVGSIPGRFTFEQFNNELVPFIKKYIKS